MFSRSGLGTGFFENFLYRTDTDTAIQALHNRVLYGLDLFTCLPLSANEVMHIIAGISVLFTFNLGLNLSFHGIN
ncbi:MAG: hypothetical protein NPIRA01_33320 [Nitrospirales bacterium]|nr:MAG: hypothetical protein NPIRA01_33320 [Nitrospirales bacterium]